MNNTSLQTTAKSFWQKKEGTTGKILMAAIFGGLIWGLYKALPTMIEFVEDIYTFLYLAVPLAFVMWLLMHPSVQMALMMTLQRIARGITSVFIAIDPVGMMKEHIRNLEKELQNMISEKAKVDAQKELVSRKLEATVKDMNDLAETIKSAQDLGETDFVTAKSGSLERKKKFIMRFKPSLQQLEYLSEVLGKVRKISAYTLEDMREEVQGIEEEVKMLRSTTSAMNSAKNILMGGGASDEINRQAREMLEAEMSNRVSQIRDFMDGTKMILKEFEITENAEKNKGMQLLETYAQTDFSYLLNRDFKSGIANSPEKILIPNTQSKVVLNSGQKTLNDYNDLIG